MIYETFLSLVSTDPLAPAVIEGASGQLFTRNDLLQRADALADEMTSRGLRSRDAVAVQLPNSAEFVAAVLAACKLDLVIVPLDRDAPASETGRILEHFSIHALVQRAGTGGTEIETRDIPDGASLPPESRLVKLTSGSTGLPRGVVTTEANLAADSTNICRSMKITPDDLNLGAIPFSHSYGFANLVLPLLLQGTPLVASNDYLPQSLIDLSNRYGCMVAPLIPMVFAHLITTAHGEFETIRTFISAGAPLAATTSSKFRERFGKEIHSFYGCSEAGGISYDREGGAVERGTVGEPMDGVVLSAEGNRLSVRSEAVAIGYLVDAATFEALPGGRFTTDDLVEFREGGEVALTGRSSDLINTAGKKVNPREVETVILQLEGVREVKVYGEEAGARGEVVAAAVVASSDVTPERVREHCRAHLSLHKVPRIVKLIERIPVDERGKVKRKALQAL